METLTTTEIWSIISSIVSVILGMFAIFLSAYFFVVGRKSEKEVSQSLTKIETQADILQKITAKQLDRLTKHVTQGTKNPYDYILPNLVTVLAELPYTITSTLRTENSNDNEQLINEVVTCYIALYFYTVQTNYWSQQFLPSLNEFDESNDMHKTIQRIVDMSNGDFERIASILANLIKADINRLESNSLIGLLTETRDIWKDYVKSSTEVYAARGQD